MGTGNQDADTPSSPWLLKVSLCEEGTRVGLGKEVPGWSHFLDLVATSHATRQSVEAGAEDQGPEVEGLPGKQEAQVQSPVWCMGLMLSPTTAY